MTVQSFISLQKAGSRSQDWIEMEDYYNRKLWHQLTLALIKYVKTGPHQSGHLSELHKTFLSDFDHRISSLALSNIGLIVSEDIPAGERLEFLEALSKKVSNHPEAKIRIMAKVGSLKIDQGQVEEVQELIKTLEELVNSLGEITPVHGAFYELSAKFYKVKGDYNSFYRDSLRYLGCIDLDDLTSKQKQEHAFHIGLSALLGDKVYNFGELLAHPLLESLKIACPWIVELLLAFNRGDMNKLEQLQPQWSQQPDLARNEVALKQKCALLGLMELTFNKASSSRSIPFSEVAAAVKLPVDEVELLVMKAISLNLVRGSIDECDKVVNLTWVQPRVLDLSQIKEMNKRIIEWAESVEKTVQDVERQIPELLCN
ncbi:26S proteasome non-ATPase regulatory subunit 13-like [Bolinopsis microptera]|uniref:26S proteasome non-ATPase regulatory subunit 13-like n=1 Tax=Bolinopsis microptera TaxID=2820187 RepID=UPI003078B444